MLTEVEKYERIQRFLSKQLSLTEQKSFESEMRNSEALRTEVEMHRLANEIAIDHYVVGLKATTNKVMQQKRLEQTWRNWGLGLGLGIAVATLGWYTIKQDQPRVAESNPPTQAVAKSPIVSPANPALELPQKTESHSKASVQKETATPATISVEVAKSTTAQEPSVFDAAPVSSAAISPAVSSAPEKITVETQPASKSIAKESEKVMVQERSDGLEPSDRLTKEIVTPVELVLNPLQGTEVELPIDADFTGDFTVFDANGASVYRCSIQSGQPHTWDGRVISGGTAGAGQYGFVLKSSSGKESVGFVTVVR